MLRSTLFAILLPISTASAQVAETWSLTIDQSAVGDAPATALVDASGATTVVGSDSTFYDSFSNTLYTDASISRVDPQGALVWHRVLHLESTQATKFTDVAAGPAGSFYASGSTSNGASSWDVVLARYGADGTPLWSLRYDAAPAETSAAVATAPNGDAWVVGQSGTEVLLMRVSPAGSIVFARTWGATTNGWDLGTAIVADPVAGAYITGRTGYTGSSSGVLLLRVDDAGNEIWSRALTAPIGEGTDVLGWDLALDASGNVYVTGTFPPPGFVPRPVVAKYDASGNLLWQRLASDATHGAGYGSRIGVDARGDVVMTGAWGGTIPVTQDVLVRKYDPSGNVVWTNSWDGPGVDYPTALALDAAGEIAVACASAPAAQPYWTDGLALRLDRNGRLLWSRVYASASPEWGVGIGFGPLGSVLFASSLGGSDLDVLVVRLDESSVPFCFGDGSGTACPCGNATPASERAGCANTLGIGGRLTADGSASLANDTLTLRGSGMPNASALYFQGTSQVGSGAGATFGDGLRCAGGSNVRLKTLVNVGGASEFPTVGDPSVSTRGQIASPGTRTYQVWYRNSAAFCTNATFNLTNGVAVTWTF